MPKVFTCSRIGCNDRSLTGLNKKLCQYHYNEYQWGTKWADRIKREDEEQTEKDK